MRVLTALSMSVILCVVFLALVAWLPSADATARGAAPMQHRDSQCVVTHSKTADPSVLLLGEEVTVTMSVDATCPDAPGPMHIVLSLDASGSMQGQKTRQMKQGAARLIRGLGLGEDPRRKLGVVEFNSQARRLCSLTFDENQAVGCVNRVGANGGTRVELGILEGLRVLSQGRSGINRTGLNEVLIVLSDGENDAGCQPALAAADQAKGQGVLVIAVCVGDECDVACMREIASGPRHFYFAQGAEQIQTVFQAILDSLLGLTLRELNVTDVWPAWMELVPDSADPPQAAPDVPDQWLKWQEAFVPGGPLTYTMMLQPTKPGYLTTNVEATGELIDTFGRSKTWVFDVPRVTVLGPDPLPTGPTPTMTSTVTPAATSTSTATATPAEVDVFLPKAGNERIPCPWTPCPEPTATP